MFPNIKDDILGSLTKMLSEQEIDLKCNGDLNLYQALERYVPYPVTAKDGPEDGTIVYLSNEKVATYHIVSSEEEIPGENLGAMRKNLDVKDTVSLIPIMKYGPFASVARTITTTDGEYAHVNGKGILIYGSHEIFKNGSVVHALSIAHRFRFSIQDLEILRNKDITSYYEDEKSSIWMNHDEIVHCIPDCEEMKIMWKLKLKIMRMAEFQRRFYEMPDKIIQVLASSSSVSILPAGGIYLLRDKASSNPRGGIVIGIIDPRFRGRHRFRHIGPDATIHDSGLHEVWKRIHPKAAVVMIDNIYNSWSKGDLQEYPKAEDAVTLQGPFQALKYATSR